MRPLRQVVNRFEVWTRALRAKEWEGEGQNNRGRDVRGTDRLEKHTYMYQVIREMRK